MFLYIHPYVFCCIYFTDQHPPHFRLHRWSSVWCNHRLGALKVQSSIRFIVFVYEDGIHDFDCFHWVRLGWPGQRTNNKHVLSMICHMQVLRNMLPEVFWSRECPTHGHVCKVDYDTNTGVILVGCSGFHKLLYDGVLAALSPQNYQSSVVGLECDAVACFICGLGRGAAHCPAVWRSFKVMAAVRISGMDSPHSFELHSQSTSVSSPTRDWRGMAFPNRLLCRRF